jgi:hypothetical protein
MLCWGQYSVMYGHVHGHVLIEQGIQILIKLFIDLCNMFVGDLMDLCIVEKTIFCST